MDVIFLLLTITPVKGLVEELKRFKCLFDFSKIHSSNYSYSKENEMIISKMKHETAPGIEKVQTVF